MTAGRRSPRTAGVERRLRHGGVPDRRPIGPLASVAEGGQTTEPLVPDRSDRSDRSDRALVGEVLVLVEALSCAELGADAAVLAQHARATARRLHALLREADDEPAAAPPAEPTAPPAGPTPAAGPTAQAGVCWRTWTFPTEGRLVAPGLCVDLDGCCAHIDGRVVQLSARQTRLLGAVAAHPGRAVPYGALALVGWRDAETDRRAALHLQFSALRSVLGLHAASCRLRAVADTGYRLEAPPAAPG